MLERRSVQSKSKSFFLHCDVSKLWLFRLETAKNKIVQSSACGVLCATPGHYIAKLSFIGSYVHKPWSFGFRPLQAKMTPSVELARAVMRDRFRPIKAPKNIIEQPQCDPKVSWVDLLELTDDVAPPGFPCTSFRTTCPGAAADGERKQSMEGFSHFSEPKIGRKNPCQSIKGTQVG